MSQVRPFLRAYVGASYLHATTPPRMPIDSIESSELQIVMQHTLAPARVDAPPRTGPGHKTPRHHVRLRQAGNRPRQTLSTRAVAQALCDQTCGPPHPRHRRGPAVVQLCCRERCLVCNAGGMCGWRPSTRARCLGAASGRGERRRRCLPGHTSCTLGVAGVRRDGGLRRIAAGASEGVGSRAGVGGGASWDALGIVKVGVEPHLCSAYRTDSQVSQARGGSFLAGVPERWGANERAAFLELAAQRRGYVTQSMHTAMCACLLRLMCRRSAPGPRLYPSRAGVASSRWLVARGTAHTGACAVQGTDLNGGVFCECHGCMH